MFVSFVLNIRLGLPGGKIFDIEAACQMQLFLHLGGDLELCFRGHDAAQAPEGLLKEARWSLKYDACCCRSWGA